MLKLKSGLSIPIRQGPGILRQLMRERKEKEDKERADRQHFYGELAEQRLRREDDQVLRYGAALLEEARAHGRPEHPIHRAIDSVALDFIREQHVLYFITENELLHFFLAFAQASAVSVINVHIAIGVERDYRYCKKYRLYPMPPLPKPLQRSFPHYKPVDKSRPDPPHQPVQIHLTNIESVFLAYGTLCEGIHD
ncbi:hypothetical protein EVAR_94945_1 [Eumeta japonica]|uniref:Uncharacterized protein n=1 Tax=Eumeta variegata TaxID=151549 RepID=A0A4C1UVT8_EUMVA|nr:hypothetical protein EVAR_94945_1 [Eumeta japonica]